MNARICAASAKKASAWTLIEMIGVLAVIAILAAVLLPMLLRQIDRAVADQESATLQSFSDALQNYVVTTRIIPSQATCYSTVASKLGISTNDVLYNARHLPRVFLTDGAMSIALPYYQTDFLGGNPEIPSNPRMMIVSSLGKALPAGLTNSVLNSSDFSLLWNTNSGAVAGSQWSGWTGDPADVLVQRVNLSGLFVHLILSQYLATTNSLAYYSIDGIDGVTAPTNVPFGSFVNGYFIQGSVLTLFTNQAATSISAKQVLTRDTSLVWDRGVWRGNLVGALNPNGMDVGDVVANFLAAPANHREWSIQTYGVATQQAFVVQTMISYMSNYNYWAGLNFPNTSLKTVTMARAQTNLMWAMQGLYRGSYLPVSGNP